VEYLDVVARLLGSSYNTAMTSNGPTRAADRDRHSELANLPGIFLEEGELGITGKI
jgi:hypothetical protein